MINTIKQNLNKYIISFLIISITLFGGLSFFIDKNIVDSYINYYIILSSGISILLLFFKNIEKFKFQKLKKIPCILTLIFFLWLLVSSIFGIGIFSETIKGFINFGCLLLLGLIIIHLEFTEEEKHFITNSIYISFFICILLGIYQYFSGVNLIQYSNSLYPGIKGRINSTFFIATILDKYIILISVILLYSLIKEPKKINYKILLLLSGIGISLTFSRSGQLVFIFLLGLLFIISLFKKQISNILIVLITILAMLLIPGTSLSIQSGLDFVYQKLNIPRVMRVNISELNNYLLNVYNLNDDKGSNEVNTLEKPTNNEEQNQKPNQEEPIINQSMNYREKYKNIGRQIIKDYPLFGIGIGNYNYLYNNQNFKDYMSDTSSLNQVHTYMYPHNTYIQTIAEIGIIGLVLLILTLLSFMSNLIKEIKMKKILFSLLLVFVLLISGYTEGVLHSKQYIFIFVLILSLMCSKTKIEEKEKSAYAKYLKRIYGKSKKDYYKALQTDLKKGNKKFIITANPETLSMAIKDKEIQNMLLDKESSIVPDGIAIVKACKILNVPVTERIAGIDIAEFLLDELNKQKKSLYLFGAKPEVIKAMVSKINNNYPNIKLLGYSDGYVKDRDKVFENIVKLKPDACFVALGIPHQEKIIYKYLNQFNKGIFVGVGGSFDVISGTKKRAPKLFIKLNLEWLYRIMCEPKRLKRFWDNNIKFILKIFQEKAHIKR